MSFKLEQTRQRFPVLQWREQQTEQAVLPIFFDGPGGAQLPESVIEAGAAYLRRGNANLGGRFATSQATVTLLHLARQCAQALVNAPSEQQMVFDSSMTNLAFKFSRCLSRDWQQGDRVIVTALDHYANVSSWQQAAEDSGAELVQVPLVGQACELDLEALLSAINHRTRVVALAAASNTTGSIIDLKPIVQRAHQHGALVFVDAVHLLPHQLADVQAMGCDILVGSAYKFFGPHIAFAYLSEDLLHRLRPYKVEPATNQGPGRFETGTLSFEAVAGFVACIDYLQSAASNPVELPKGRAMSGAELLRLRAALVEAYQHYSNHEQQLSELFLTQLSQLSHVSLFGREQASSKLRTPTFALRWHDYSPEYVAQALADHGVCVWHGHFYAQGLIEHLGLMEQGGVVRVGMMHYNTVDEVHRFFELCQQLFSAKQTMLT